MRTVKQRPTLPARVLHGSLALSLLLVLLPAAARAANVTSVTVSPADAELTAGFALQYTATAHMSDGSTQDVTTTAEWRTSSSRTAIVSNTDGSRGLVTGVGEGDVRISARVLDGESTTTGSATLHVKAARILSLSTKPTSKRLALGVDKQFSAKAVFENGQEGDVTDEVEWSSTYPGIASVDASGPTIGLVHPNAVGQAIIRVRDPRSGLTNSDADGTVKVTAAITDIEVVPQSLTLARRLRYPLRAYGNRSDQTRSNITSRVQWIVSAPNRVTVEDSTGTTPGLLTAIRNGTVTITAFDPDTGKSSDSTGGSATVTVAGRLVGLRVSPASIKVGAGETRSVHAFGQLFGGGETSELSDVVDWSIANPAFATIGNGKDDKGDLTGIKIGKTTLTAREPNTGISSLDIPVMVRGEIVSIEVEPSGGKVPLGETFRYKARAKFSDGSKGNVSGQCNWSILNPAIAAVDDEGVVTALNLGKTTVRAECNGKVETAPVRVIGHLTGVLVLPNPFEMDALVEKQFRAQGQYDDGSKKDLTKEVDWSSSNTQVATVNNDDDPGNVRGLSAGMARITATDHSGKSGFSDLTITGNLTSLQLMPPSLALRGSTGKLLTATGHFSDGSSDKVNRKVQWSSSNDAVARVSNEEGENGFVIGGGTEGTAMVTAASPVDGSINSSVPVTVAGILTSLKLNPESTVIAINATRQLAARADYSDGEKDVRVTNFVEYQSSNPGVAIVSNLPGAHGLVTAVSSGIADITAIDPSTGITAANAVRIRVP